MQRKRRQGGNSQKPGAAVLASASKGAKSHLFQLLTLSFARVLLRIAFAGGLAVFAATAVIEGRVDGTAILILVIGLAGAAFLQKETESGTARAEEGVALAILADVEHAAATRPATEISGLPIGSVVSGVARQPGAVARLVVRTKLARQLLMLGPLAVAAAVAFVSWQAATLLLMSIPAMIALFILVGRATSRRARAQEEAMGRLATQFADRMRSLPTILASDAFEAEANKLDARMSEYGARTARVLSLAFLNSAALDLFATLSIAVMAVLLGMGLLGVITLPGFAGLEGWQTFFILLLIPEFYAPFRRYSEGYHAKAEGEAAAEALSWAYSEIPVPSLSLADIHGCAALVLPHGGAVEDVTLPTEGLIVLTGPSGSGKTTLLRVLAGVEPPALGKAGLAAVDSIAWVSTDAPLSGPTLAKAIEPSGGAPVSAAQVMQVAAQLNLLGDPLLPAGLETRLPEGECPLSGGQRVRAVLARALLSGRAILADEPTAKLDAANAKAARRALRAAATTRLVIAATHDTELCAMADGEISLSALPRKHQKASA